MITSIICLSFFFILVSTFISCEDTTSSVDNTDTTVTIWTKENSPYVMDTFIVEKGIKLIIEPGVTVAFKTGCGLIVKGELSAIGTEADSIIFIAYQDTVYHKVLWGGVKFDSCESNTRLEYCVFKDYYFGTVEPWSTDEFAILCDNSSPTFSRCMFLGVFTACETGGGVIRCMNNSSPCVKYSLLYMYGYKTACVACAPTYDDLFNEYINPDSSNPSLFQNDFYINDDGYAVAGGGFLNGNYINILLNKIDTSLGTPVDEVGDGIFTTNSTSCVNVDGITNPRATPHFPDN